MGVLEWILVAIVISGLGQFGLLSYLSVSQRRVPWGQKRAGVRPPRKTESTKTRTDHVDIESVTHTINIPTVSSSKVIIEETTIKNKADLNKLRELRK